MLVWPVLNLLRLFQWLLISVTPSLTVGSCLHSTLHHRHCPQMFFVNTKHISASGSLHFLLALSGITFLCKSKWLVFRSLLISSVSLSMPSCLHLQSTSCHPGPYLSSPNVLTYVSLTAVKTRVPRRGSVRSLTLSKSCWMETQAGTHTNIWYGGFKVYSSVKKS